MAIFFVYYQPDWTIMTDPYAHITKMEKILDEHAEILKKLNAILEFIDSHQEEYQKLVDYYYSGQRNQDLKDDEEHRIPQNLKRGVLSEDGIYNFIGDYFDTSVRMMEVGVKMLKSR